MQQKGSTVDFLDKLQKFEPIFLGIMLVGFVGIYQNWPYTDKVLIIASGLLALLYLLKAQFYIDTSWMPIDRWYHRILFLGLAIGIIAFLFHIQNWRGWLPMLFISMMGFCIAFMGIALKRGSLLKFMNAIELSSLLLVMIYFIRAFWGNL